MFAALEPSRKRLREDDEHQDEGDSLGFSAHRFKRHVASLPHRQLNRPASPIQEQQIDRNGNPYLAPPTITPADSDSEDILDSTEPRSYFSPWSSSVVGTPVQNSQQSYVSSQMSMSDTAMLSDDSDMAMSTSGDMMHLSPAPYQTDPVNNISSRIPTPIHSSFGPFTRLGTGKAPAFRIEGLFTADDDDVDNSIMRRRRRLPSPISEGLPSPSVIVEGIEDMQMEVETDSDMPISPLTRPPGLAQQPISLSLTPPQSRSQDENLDPYSDQDSFMSLTTPTKKGHVRSKHTLRNWAGLVPEANRNGTGPKRGFSIGYRSDCEKCRMKVPGHFSHIVTY